MDISIVQFKRHYVFVCIMVAFSLAGVFVGYREFLSASVFTTIGIDSIYSASFFLFSALGVMLPQWLLKAIFISEQNKPTGGLEGVNTLPTGRADLQSVTLAISGTSLTISLMVVVAVFFRPIFCQIRSWLYGNFYLGPNVWIVDVLLVFLFSGAIWTLAGFLCAMLYRMVLSLTTQTGVYQTLEQRFYLLLFGGWVSGLFFWNYFSGLLLNTRLLVIFGLLPLVVSSFWLPLFFSRSAERSYVKHFELKSGVKQRRSFSIRSVCFCVFAGGVLTGAYLPILSHIESLVGFGLIPGKYIQPCILLFVLSGWYFAFRRDISGRQSDSGIITPLYRWSGSCLGVVFVLSLINRQHWSDNLLAILLWYVFCGYGLFFLGDMLFNLKQLVARSQPSMSLSWVLWVFMLFLGCVCGNLLLAHFLLSLVGSLVVIIFMFFGGVIATGVTIVFTSPQEHWHRRVILVCIMPIVVSTLVIFWIAHNWILKKQGDIIGFRETLTETWILCRHEGSSNWYSRADGRLVQGWLHAGLSYGGLWLSNIMPGVQNGRVLISGNVLEDVPFLDREMKKDVIFESGAMLSNLPTQRRMLELWGIENIYVDFEQVVGDRWSKYDVIWLDQLSLNKFSWENVRFWHRLISLMAPGGTIAIGCDTGQCERETARLILALTRMLSQGRATIAVIETPVSPEKKRPAYTIITIKL